MKSTFYARIVSVKFATNFTESLCSPVVTFPSFRLEGHGVQPHRGTPFFAIFVLYSSFFFFRRILFFFYRFLDQVKSFFFNPTFSVTR